MNTLNCVFLLLAGLLILFPQGAMAQRAKAYRYIALGDSISAGFLGFTQISQRGAGARSMMSEYEEPPPPHVWKGIRYPALVESKRGYSWATGSQSYSFTYRLEDWIRENTAHDKAVVHWANLAESGALAAHMPRQARLAMANLRSDQELAMISLMIGANDACDSLSTTQEEETRMLNALRETYRRISVAHTSRRLRNKFRVLVSSVPNIPVLGSKQFLDHPAYLGMTCRDVRADIVNFCPLLTAWKTEAEYEVRHDRVRFINKILKDSVRLAALEFKNLDVIFDDTFFEYPLQPTQLAADCFHPGRTGSAELARALWDNQRWFKNKTTLPVTPVIVSD